MGAGATGQAIEDIAILQSRSAVHSLAVGLPPERDSRDPDERAKVTRGASSSAAAAGPIAVGLVTVESIATESIAGPGIAPEPACIAIRPTATASVARTVRTSAELRTRYGCGVRGARSRDMCRTRVGHDVPVRPRRGGLGAGGEQYPAGVYSRE